MISIVLSILPFINGDNICELQKTKKQEDIFLEKFEYKCLNKTIFDLEDDKIGRQIKLKCYDLERLPHQSMKQLPIITYYNIIVLEHCALMLSNSSLQKYFKTMNTNFAKNITTVTFEGTVGQKI